MWFWLAMLLLVGVLAWRGTIRTFWPLPDWHAARMRKLRRQQKKQRIAARRRASKAGLPMSPRIEATVHYDDAPTITAAESDRLRMVGELLDSCPHKGNLPAGGPYRCPCGITWYPPRRSA